MGNVTVELPRVLAELAGPAGGERRFQVSGESIGDALKDLVRQQPALGLHLFDEAGSIRRHILCFHNQAYARGREGLALPVRPGDRITILNSVAGG